MRQDVSAISEPNWNDLEKRVLHGDHAAFIELRKHSALRAHTIIFKAVVNSRDRFIHTRGLSHLEEFGAFDVVTALTKLAACKRLEIRYKAVRALRTLMYSSDVRVEQTLTQLLADENPTIREIAAYSLAKIPRSSALETVLRYVRAAPNERRETADFVLRRCNYPIVMERLTNAVQDQDLSRREEAKRILSLLNDFRKLAL
jgi:HEAT repeat protein